MDTPHNDIHKVYSCDEMEDDFEEEEVEEEEDSLHMNVSDDVDIPSFAVGSLTTLQATSTSSPLSSSSAIISTPRVDQQLEV